MSAGSRDGVRRIVVSGTHASGKSTLVTDFADRHPGVVVLADPAEDVDGSEAAGPDAFFAQLRVAAARLLRLPPAASVIAERGPLDFLAYLAALDVLRRPTGGHELLRAGRAITMRAMAEVDLLVLLPLSPADGIVVPDDEDPELRAAMNDALLEFADDPDLVQGAMVVEIAGGRASRIEQLEAAVGPGVP